MTRRRSRVLVLGGGFAGIYCARKLEKLDPSLQVSLVSSENFFVFTPMLPQVVSGMIESNHIVVPVRQILKKTRFYEARVESIDVWNKRVTIATDRDDGGHERLVMEYDQLVVALGSSASFARMPHIQPYVFTLKSLKDALVLRNHIIDMLERADIEPDPEKKKQLLTFVIVGGGLSGIETAGELDSFFHEAVRYYPHIGDVPVELVLVQSSNRILPELDGDLADFTLRQLHKSGVRVYMGCKVVDVTPSFVRIRKNGNGDGNSSSSSNTSNNGGKEGAKAVEGGEGKEEESTIAAKTVIWTAGVSPSPVVGDIPCEGDRPSSGRLPVDEFLRVRGYDNIWAIGDCAHILSRDGRGNSKPDGDNLQCPPYPPTAQHAIREAEAAALNIARSMHGRQLKEFHYGGDKQMAVVGERKAIAKISGLKLYGYAAWWLWRIVYLQKLPMLKKRLRVLSDWAIDMFFDRDLTHIRGLRDDGKTAASLATAAAVPPRATVVSAAATAADSSPPPSASAAVAAAKAKDGSSGDSKDVLLFGKRASATATANKKRTAAETS
jgi:NADH dehydrogenase